MLLKTYCVLAVLLSGTSVLFSLYWGAAPPLMSNYFVQNEIQNSLQVIHTGTTLEAIFRWGLASYGLSACRGLGDNGCGVWAGPNTTSSMVLIIEL